MSEFLADPPSPPPAAPASRRPRPIILVGLAMAAFLLLFSVFTSIWTEKLWFSSVGYSEIFSKLVLTRVGLFVGFGLLMAVIVGINLFVAYRLRPTFRPRSPEQMQLDRYRQLVIPMRRLLLVGVSLVFGLFAGMSASGQWRTFLLWINREPFGTKDPEFGRDIGFYVFSLPWLHFVVDFLMTALVLGLLAALLVHYVFGGVSLQSAGEKFTRGARAQVCVLLGVLVLVKAADYWLDRFDLTTSTGSLITGMTYTRDHAVLPSKNILVAIAVICAVLFFVNVVRNNWLLPGVGIALFALSSVLLGMLWPAAVQRFQVKPNEADKEATYITNNIKATRAAYGLEDTKVTEYAARTTLNQAQLRADAASLPGIRLVDPQQVSDTFEQLQQVRGYYSVPEVLDVDRYEIDGRERDVVVAAREMNVDGIPDGGNWLNTHTVYTHGYGLIAAFGNQRDAADNPVATDGEPVWAEEDLPPVGKLTDLQEDGYRPQIYFGERSPEYSIVGKAKGGKDIELDIPQGQEGGGSAKTSTYDGKDGVKIGNVFNKLLYATKFGDFELLLSDRVNENSRILYDRSPRERVQKVAPWLTVDNDALPSVVDGKIVWILDGYTVSDRYPMSQKRSLEEMTSDAVNPRSAYATLPTDQINYMRNAVKATVDAYDGTVTLYGWDEDDPILKAWKKVFPGVVKDRADIPEELLEHLRYPEDQFKVQRNMLAAYHVEDAKTFYEKNDRWSVPSDPASTSTIKRNQPPYRLSVSTTPGEDPTFSLTSVYVPSGKQNLASFISVGADATDESYGKFEILRLPDNTQVQGPQQIANQFANDPKVAEAVRPFKQADAEVSYGNLLTLPVGEGLLYVQPLYTIRSSGEGRYPVLRFVLVSFGKEIGIGSTLSAALDDVLGVAEGTTPDGSEDTSEPDPDSDSGSDSGDKPDTPSTGDLPVAALKLLQQADAKFAEADKALKAGDLAGYAKAVEEARALVTRALGQ